MLHKLSDDNLLKNISEIVIRERKISVAALLYFSEVSKRELYLKLGYRSMFDYLTQKFHYSEGAAGRRLAASRLLARYPDIKIHLEDGSLSMTTLQILSFQMHTDDFEILLKESVGKSRSQIDELIAKRSKQPSPKKEVVRLVFKEVHPAVQKRTSPAELTKSEKMHAEDELPEMHMRVSMTIDAKTYNDLELLRKKLGEADLASVVKRLVQAKLHKKPKTKTPPKPSPSAPKASLKPSRYIAAEIERQVIQKAGHQCEYTFEGHRCTEVARLHIDHILPYAMGGDSTAANVQMLCDRHNLFMAKELFGREYIESKYIKN